MFLKLNKKFLAVAVFTCSSGFANYGFQNSRNGFVFIFWSDYHYGKNAEMGVYA